MSRFSRASRATVSLPSDQNARVTLTNLGEPPDPSRPRSYEAWPCRSTVAGFEVYDSVSGGTRFVNPGVIRSFNPQPDPPKD